MFQLFPSFEWPTELRSIVTMGQHVAGNFYQADHISSANPAIEIMKGISGLETSRRHARSQPSKFPRTTVMSG
jgi:hypothetical protein